MGGVILGVVAFVLTMYQAFFGKVPITAAPAVAVAREYPRLTEEQAKQVREAIEQRFQERLAEERKKWEASLAPKITEEAFLKAILP